MNTTTNFTTERLKTIREAAQAYYPQGTLHEEKAVSAFIRGAKWADNNPKKGLVSIDKVSELLKKHINISGFESVKFKWIEQICKALEE